MGYLPPNPWQSRRQFLQFSLAGLLSLGATQIPKIFAAESDSNDGDLASFEQFFWNQNKLANKDSPNVLFISVDDLNDWIGPLGGYPGVKTPNIDRLSAMGVTFQKAYCAIPACGGSRSSIMSGIAPSRSGLYGQEHILNYEEDFFAERGLVLKSIPRAFKEKGYKTLGGGKLFHRAGYGNKGALDRKNRDNIDPGAWSEDYQYIYGDDVTPNYLKKGQGIIKQFEMAYDENEAAMPDKQLAAWAANQLNRQHQSPFFLGVGIYRPHLPWIVPKRFYDLYPLERIKVPESSVEEADLQDLPNYAKKYLIDIAKDQEKFDDKLGSNRKAIQAYLASISFADECVGTVLDALKNSEYADNTIVCLWSDHGWHLGEKLGWRKFKLWEKATRIPLIISTPGGAKGVNCDSPVSSLDIYPTLIDLCFEDSSPFLDGHSLKPLINNPNTMLDNSVLTGWRAQWKKGRKDISYSVRTNRWRYILYPDGSEELYDLAVDTQERTNLLHPMHGKQALYSPIRDLLKQKIPKERPPLPS